MTSQYSRVSGRWNETPKPSYRNRSLHQRTPVKPVSPNHLFCVNEEEREIWVRNNILQLE